MDHQNVNSNSIEQEPAQASNEAWEKAVPRSTGLLTDSDRVTLSAAAAIYERVLTSRGVALTSPRDAGDFIKARLFGYPYEVFACLFLDNRHRVLCFTEIFRGTVDGAQIFPREVVKEALSVNACAVLFAHNHPSGVADPSQADRAITRELRDALQLVSVRVLDHLIIGDGEPVSMAARGLI